MSANRRDEKFAFTAVERVLGVTAEEYDTAGRQNAIDAILHYPNGRIAALEVSSLGPIEEARLTNVLASRSHRRSVPGLTQTWMVTIPRNFHPADLPKIDELLLQAERLGFDNLRYLHDQDLPDEHVAFRVRAFAHPPTAASKGPEVWLLTEALGGFAGGAVANLARDTDEALTTELMQSKLTKLAASGYEERHLFLHVRPSAFSFAAYYTPSFGGPLPNGAPALPLGLSQVWLVSGWKEGGLVRGVAGREWRRDNPFD